jgi:hypothetical protein
LGKEYFLVNAFTQNRPELCSPEKMLNNRTNAHLQKFIDQAPVWLLLILGMWLVVLRPLGPHLALVPGDLGDARFNNYILEHFFQWVRGTVGDYWTAPFYYPFPLTTAFSDNLLGSAPFYALFRWVGVDRATAYQGWYILGYLLNFLAAGYVLSRLKLKPLAVGAGAFFFTFGLPLLAQENHVQLLYRFCVPLACYSLWRFTLAPRLKTLIYLGAWLVWQYYLTIYIGIFLSLLLIVLFVLIPCFMPKCTIRQRLAVWPRSLIRAWSVAHLSGRISAVIAAAMLGLGFVVLIFPYYHATRLYGFSRSWMDVLTKLPVLKSYLLTDNSQLWGGASSLITNISPRWEHQLFPGLAVVALVLAGIAWRYQTHHRKLAWMHFTAALVLIILTLEVRGFSLYILVYLSPGMDSLRAVTRIMLVVMWPLALFIAWVVDGMLQRLSEQQRWMQAAAYLVVGLLVVESIFYNHATYVKADAQARLDALAQQISAVVPVNPILYVAENPQDPSYATEIDAMLLSQQLGWPTLNGYSGNSPPYYMPPSSCKQLPEQIKNYMAFAGITSESFYLDMMKRVVPLGFTGCDPAWWEHMP